jgi:uncharacterized protein YcfL
MRKIVIIICVLLCVGELLVACSSTKSFEIQNAIKVELRSGNTGNTVEITDKDIIQQITNNISSLRYEKGNSSNNSTGWSYSIKWYEKDGVLIEEIVIIGSQTIDYKGKTYTVLDGSIDIESLDHLVSESYNRVTNNRLDTENTPVELDLVSGEYRAIWKESYNYNTPILINDSNNLKEFLNTHPAQSASEDILQQNYNDEFFKQSVIYAYVKSEGSGSVKLTVNRAELNGDILKLLMDRAVPKVGTTDMATRVCLFGVIRNDIKNVKTIEGIILDRLSE